MFSLRDLIFSQQPIDYASLDIPRVDTSAGSQIDLGSEQLKSQYQSTFPSQQVSLASTPTPPGSINRKRASRSPTALSYTSESNYEQSYQDRNSEQGDESEIEFCNLEQGSQHSSRFLGALPNGFDPLYLNSPQIQFKKEISLNNTELPFGPNQLSYVRFPINEDSVPRLQREITRKLWQRCYEGHDYTGALMALRVLVEIDSVSLLDMQRLVEIIRLSNTSHKFLANEVYNAVHNIILHKNTELKSVLYAWFVQVVDFEGDSSLARKFLREKRTNQAMTTCPLLQAFDSILACQEVVDLSLDLSKKLNLSLTLPTLAEIVEDPFKIYFNTRLILFASSGSSMENTISSNKMRYRNCLKEVLSSFLLSSTNQNALVWLEFQELYLAFLLGAGQVKRALEQISLLSDTIFSVPSAEMEFEAAFRSESPYLQHKLTALLVRVCIRLDQSSPDEVLHKSFYLQRRYILTASPSLLDETILCCAWLLFQENWITQDFLIEMTADLLEMTVGLGRNFPNSPYIQFGCPREWSMWKLMCVGLGPLPAMIDDDAPIEADFSLTQYIPELVVGSGNLERPVNEYSEANFISRRRWWLDNFLSASLLDDFSDSKAETEEVTDILEHLLECAPPKDLTVVNFSSIYKEKAIFAIKEWSSLDELFQEEGFHSIVQDIDCDFEIDVEVEVESLPGERRSVQRDDDGDEAKRFFKLEIIGMILERKGPSTPITDLFVASDGGGSEFIVQKIFAPSTNSNNMSEEMIYLLSKPCLQLLSFQAIVAAHLAMQDNFFTVRVVQILMKHALLESHPVSQLAARECLSLLKHHKLNLRRALRIGQGLASRCIPVDFQGPTYHLLSSDCCLPVTGLSDGCYIPALYA